MRTDCTYVFTQGSVSSFVSVLVDYGEVGTLGHLVRIACGDHEVIVRATELRLPTEWEGEKERIVAPVKPKVAEYRQRLNLRVVTALSAVGGRAKSGDLAMAIGWNNAKLAAVVRRMEREGLVAKHSIVPEGCAPYEGHCEVELLSGATGEPE